MVLDKIASCCILDTPWYNAAIIGTDAVHVESRPPAVQLFQRQVDLPLELIQCQTLWSF